MHWRECRARGSVARVLRSPMIVTGVVLAAGLSAPAEARDNSSVVDRACLSVRVGGYRATNLHAQRLTCRSARTKLRRWLGRGRLPHNSVRAELLLQAAARLGVAHQAHRHDARIRTRLKRFGS